MLHLIFSSRLIRSHICVLVYGCTFTSSAISSSLLSTLLDFISVSVSPFRIFTASSIFSLTFFGTAWSSLSSFRTDSTASISLFSIFRLILLHLLENFALQSGGFIPHVIFLLFQILYPQLDY